MSIQQMSLVLFAIAAIYTLGLIVALIYVAVNKPQNRAAGRYTVTGLALFVASQLSGLILRPAVGLVDRWFEFGFALIVFVQTMIGALAILSLVKAVYVASRSGQDFRSPIPSNPVDSKPPFRPIDQQF